MTRRKRSSYLLLTLAAVATIAVMVWVINSRGPAAEKTAYSDPFDVPGSWMVGDDPTAQGQVNEGAYEMYVELSGDIFWVTGGRTFADATYELEATPLEGTLDNGYGMLFRVDSEAGDFYVFSKIYK